MEPLNLLGWLRFDAFQFTRSQIRMSYSFTWRTVEALVGFPYSMYASVRLGEHLTEQVRLRVKAKFARLLVLGEISYVAQKLAYVHGRVRTKHSEENRWRCEFLTNSSVISSAIGQMKSIFLSKWVMVSWEQCGLPSPWWLALGKAFSSQFWRLNHLNVLQILDRLNLVLHGNNLVLRNRSQPHLWRCGIGIRLNDWLGTECVKHRESAWIVRGSRGTS